jgi:hypothetical protein
MLKRVTTVKKWLRRNYLQATLLLALSINVIALKPAFSSSLKIGKKDFLIQICMTLLLINYLSNEQS